MLKRLLIVLAVLLGLAAAADRYLAGAAGDAAGGQVRRSAKTAEDAKVTFRGFPFITQAMVGRFQRVDVVARDVPVGGIRLSRVDARFDGVHVKFGKALAGELEAVPTDKAAATARLTFDDLNAYLRRRGSLTVAPSGEQVLVSGRVRLNGALIDGRGRARVTLRPGSIVLQVTEASASGIAVPPAAARLLTVTVPTKGMPFGIALRSVEVESDALVLRGSASGVVIPTLDVLG